MESYYGEEICNGSDTIFNLTNPDKAYHFLYGPLDKLLITVVVPAVSLLGILGNLAFLFMCIRVKELRKAPVTIYLANLAVCDILFLLATNGWYVLSLFTNPVNLAFPVDSTLGCALWVISTHWWYPASLGFITLISFERYFAICRPMTHRMNKKARNLNHVLVTWILALLLTVTIVPQYGKFSTNCMLWPETEDFADLPVMVNECEAVNQIADIYANLVAIMLLILTLVINFVLFVRIISALRNHAKRSRRRSVSSVADRASTQVTRTLVANGIIFFICQLPLRVFTLDDVFDNLDDIMNDNLDDKFNFLSSQYLESFILLVGRAFLLLNAVINPFLYVFSCQHYRQAMVRAFCGSRCTKTDHEQSGQMERESALTATASNP